MNESVKREAEQAFRAKCDTCGSTLMSFMDAATGLNLPPFCLKCEPEQFTRQMKDVEASDEHRIRWLQNHAKKQ
jgi:hypothetical protein